MKHYPDIGIIGIDFATIIFVIGSDICINVIDTTISIKWNRFHYQYQWTWSQNQYQW